MYLAVDGRGERFTGRAIYIYLYRDDSTRTNKVRVQLANRGGRLKPGMHQVNVVPFPARKTVRP